VYETNVGDVLTLAPAVGTTGWSGDRPPAVLIASGTGVTPFAAMLDERARSKGGTKRGGRGGAVALVLCAERPGGVYDLESVRRIEAAVDWLHVETVEGPEAPSTLAADERWDDERWGSGAEVHLCGSPWFVSDVVEALAAAGRNTDSIRLEQYASTSPAPLGATAHGGGKA
jgi:ferredoxin-NADP reductase